METARSRISGASATTEPFRKGSGAGHGLVNSGETIMLKGALIFLVISIVAGFFGFSGVSAATAKIAKVLFGIAIVVFIIFVVLTIMAGQAIL